MIDTVGPEGNWPDNIRVMTTTRVGGVSLPPYDTLNLALHVGDNPDHVWHNREQARYVLDMPAEPLYLDQQHTARVVHFQASDRGLKPVPVADASWTMEPEVVLAVMTADCLPIVLASEDGQIIACIHAGWRGLADGIIEKAVEALPVVPSELLAWIGPGISAGHFEVGPEVRMAVMREGRAQADHFMPHAHSDRLWMDLKSIACWQLAQCGLWEHHIEVSTCCTWEDNRFYSYRRDGVTGRMATYVWRTQ